MIAIVGMAVRAPAPPSVNALWEHVSAGTNCIETFPQDAAELSPVDSRLLAHGTHVMAGGALGDIANFDPDYFGLSRLDAAILDPQQRVFLELVRHALDDAAAPASRNEVTAVYAGCAMSSYLQNNLLADLDLVERVGAYPLTLGNDKDFLATRVSHRFGFGGPSMTVQTACSTSLVAVHVAASSLLAGECDTAIAGGVTIRVPEQRGYLYQPDGIMAVDGVCRPFDAAATGFVPSNGGVVLVLRRLDDALAERDPIRAVLLATAVNNDGAARPGFTAPSVEGQVRLLSEALALSELSPAEISYAETHGTATALGDLVEFEALRRVYGPSDVPCFLGASKANFGHTDTAAGALGLAKAVLSLEHRRIPPVANFERANPRLEIEGTRFVVPSTLTEWVTGVEPRRAAVTSLGLGGTNAHVIVEEAPVREAPRGRAVVLPVSAHSAAAARARADDIERVVKAQPGRAVGLAAALASEGHLPYRVVVEPLETYRSQAPAVRKVLADRVSVILAFPGGGAQHPAMATSLAEAEPAFAKALDEALGAIEPMTGPAIREAILCPNEGTAAELRRPAIGLPALFCVQIATWRLIASWGVRPAAVIGHSAGEYVAACVADVLELAEAARLVVTRAQLFESAPRGAMVGLLLPEDDVRRYLEVAPGLEIAALNGAAETVVGGPAASIAVLESYLADRGIPSQRVPVDVAAHTAGVSSVAEALERVAAEIPIRGPSVPWVSNLTGTWIADDELGPQYWGTHLRRTVRFADGMRTALANPGTVLLDMGPSQVLMASVERNGLPDGVLALAALPHPRSDDPAPLHVRGALAQLWSAGVAIDPTAPDLADGATRESLPPYPFEHIRCWISNGRPAGVSRLRHRFYDPVLEALDAVDEPKTAATSTGGWLVASDRSPFSTAVLEHLERDGVPIAAIVNADVPWPRSDRDGSICGALVVAGTDPWQTYHAITEAARALATSRHGPPELVSVSNAEDPVSGLCTALMQVVRNEYPNLAARSVEVEEYESDLRLIARELYVARGVDVVLRGGGRFGRALRQLPVDAAAKPVLRKGGVWIISGGLGAIGRTLAVHLAETRQARLVLVVRSREGGVTGEAPMRDAALRAITAAGGSYELVVGDIADPAVARRAVERAEQVFGGIDGVIHAAGLPAGGVIELRSRDDAEQVLRPKLGGLLALDEAIGDRNLEAFVLCSALDAVLGTPGQAEHCAGNGYLDVFAEVGARRGRPVVSLGWSAWQQIGQAARAVIPAALRSWREKILAEALTPEGGCVVFDAALASRRPRVVVSADDPASLRRLAARANSLTGDSPRPAVLHESLETPVERGVAELWIEVLAAATVCVDDDFFGLGGHSLAAMQLVSRLRETFGVPVTLPELLERPGLRDQAALVEELLIDVIEQLDDSEVIERLDALALPDDYPPDGDAPA